MGHKRNQSEGGGIMERGRPRRRGEFAGGLKHSASRLSDERRAFETLPTGWKVGEVGTFVSHDELVALRSQALQQAARFEVLKEDVDDLSE